jgi:nitrite reductase (cytochrome c-552)
MMAGPEKVCASAVRRATALVRHPVAHGLPRSGEHAVCVTRPGFLNGIKALAASADPVPHLPSVERWRTGDRKSPYDLNALARQELRLRAASATSNTTSWARARRPIRGSTG